MTVNSIPSIFALVMFIGFCLMAVTPLDIKFFSSKSRDGFLFAMIVTMIGQFGWLISSIILWLAK